MTTPENKNEEVSNLLYDLIQYIPEKETKLLKRTVHINNLLKSRIYSVNLDLDRAFYRLNNLFEE